jgi:hypothetical protein
MVLSEFLAAVLATFLLLHTVTHFNVHNTDPFELLHIGSLLAVILYFGLSCHRQLWGDSANVLRYSLRDGSVAGDYSLDFVSFDLQEEVMLVANLFIMLQVFRYVRFFKSLKLINGACERVGWGVMIVVLASVAGLLVFSTAGVLMFSEFDPNFSSFPRALITLSRCYFGTFKFGESAHGRVVVVAMVCSR